jgi:hypothetical protein
MTDDLVGLIVEARMLLGLMLSVVEAVRSEQDLISALILSIPSGVASTEHH